jgi:hypothetical protein
MSREPRRDLHAGPTLGRLLDADDVLDEVEAAAVKRALAGQLTEIMRAKRISKKAMAERMGTSRSQLDRLLDPSNASVQLNTIARAARVVGKRLRIEMV